MRGRLGQAATLDERRHVRRLGRRLAGVPRLRRRAAPGSEQFKLGVITNCDDDLFALSEARLGVGSTR